MSDNLDELRKTAEAEPTHKWGSWNWEPSDWDDEHAVFIDDGHPGRSFVAERISQGTDGGEATARFIATFDPPVVLELIKRAETAEQAVADYEVATLAVHRVRELHGPIAVFVNLDTTPTAYCAHCYDQQVDDAEYPCPTIRALDGDGRG